MEGAFPFYTLSRQSQLRRRFSKPCNRHFLIEAHATVNCNEYLPTYLILDSATSAWKILAHPGFGKGKVLVPRKSRTLVKLPVFNMGLTCGEKAIFIFGAVRCRE